jgi:phage terminase large subunit
MLQRTTAQSKIAKIKKRIRIIQGGTSSSKTFSIIPLLIHYAVKHPRQEISIVAESLPHLRRGAIRDFVKIMEWTGMFRPLQWNKSSYTYKFQNGSFIEFFSADQPDKLRGARRDVLFINECNGVEFEAYQQLSIRTRKFIYLDFNPTTEFWVHKQLENLPDAEKIILTYKDNEALSPSIVKEIEKAKEKAKTSKYWENWWRVYGLGQVGVIEGVIFQDWKQIKSVPPEARLLGHGLDFGYTNDPTAIVSIYKYNDEIIVDEEIYQTGLLNSDIARLCKQNKIGTTHYIYADLAEPKSIQEIKRQGVRITGATKGRDSVNYGINLIQEHNLVVTERSKNLIKELQNYKWATDRTGEKLNKPIDAYNHAIDALRYAFIMALDKKKGQYYVR